MISICIPIYNNDVRELVSRLSEQSVQLDAPCEILLIDDASTNGCKKANSSLAELPNVRYKELPENIGRSAIRNLLAKEAIYRYLIFMDCDAQVCSDDFLQKYFSCCKDGIVCYGGKKTVTTCPAPEFRLRWLCSIKREQPNAIERNIRPNRSFITFNFLIDKEIFKKATFDENLRNSNHEDTIFGFRLSEAGITVSHIDNPLLFCNFDDSATFLKKTERGLQNLSLFYDKTENKGDFARDVKLLCAWRKLNFCGLTGLFAILFHSF
ncbi:MAG: glycosyltransferase, partial [Prevotella sp.]|nr:glycosyltransferase [Prevotella sp.]